jgi:hypothetical protein
MRTTSRAWSSGIVGCRVASGAADRRFAGDTASVTLVMLITRMHQLARGRDEWMNWFEPGSESDPVSFCGSIKLVCGSLHSFAPVLGKNSSRLPHS